MKRFIAFSGGVESSAMVVLYGADATPIFTDAGWEHGPMEKRINDMENAYQILHGPSRKIIRLKAENVEGTGANTLPEYIRIRKFLPNFKARFCTRLFKIATMDKFLAEQGECEVLIGLNFDEADERVGNYVACKNVKYSYPLDDDGYTREHCEKLLSDMGLLPNFPAYMKRGGCKGCYMKSRKEYEAMAILNPKEALSVAELEEDIQDARGSYFSIIPGIPMRQFIERAQTGLLIEPKDLYPEHSTQQTACGVFCMR